MSHSADSPLAPGQSSPAPDAGLSDAIKEHARRLGFDFCRIASVETALHADFFDLWLAGCRAAEMAYLERNADKRRNPLLLAADDSDPFRSIIVLAVNYHQFDLPASLRDDPSRGVIASYAWSDDYHEVIRPLLHELDSFIRSRTGRTTRGKCLVDTGPVLERDWAQHAGIGFTGKNCCTIHPLDGSWLFLATVIVPETLRCDSLPSADARTHNPSLPAQAVIEGLLPEGDYGAWEIPLAAEGSGREHRNSRTGACGRCTRCLDACPTDAFAGPYHLDPRRCISYWTIESQQPIPRAIRPHFRNRIFGCDICQEVCPWNRRLALRTPVQEGLRARQDRVAIPLLEGFAPGSPYWLSEEAFRARFRRSPLLRARRSGMLRNVCVALGNWASPDAVPALTQALYDSEALARGHAAWALGRIAHLHRHAEAARLLDTARSNEDVDWVRAELAAIWTEGRST